MQMMVSMLLNVNCVGFYDTKLDSQCNAFSVGGFLRRKTRKVV